MQFTLKRLLLQANSEKQMYGYLFSVDSIFILGEQRNIHVNEPQIDYLRIPVFKMVETLRVTL